MLVYHQEIFTSLKYKLKSYNINMQDFMIHLFHPFENVTFGIPEL